MGRSGGGTAVREIRRRSHDDVVALQETGIKRIHASANLYGSCVAECGPRTIIYNENFKDPSAFAFSLRMLYLWFLFRQITATTTTPPPSPQQPQQPQPQCEHKDIDGRVGDTKTS